MDAIALIGTNKWKLGKFKVVRICADVICIMLGVWAYLSSGGTAAGISSFIGPGTIFTAFCMGPLIEYFNKQISIPFLLKR